MLNVSHLSGGYQKKEVLHNVSFTAESGHISAIIGPNGCGKSTLLKTLCRLLPASGGSISYDGQNLLTLNNKEFSQKVSYLSQSRKIPDISVERLVLHGRFPYLGYPKRYQKSDYEIVRSCLRETGIEQFAESLLSELSGGERQKAYIAMALCQETDLLLLDEPITYLDVSQQLRILNLTKDLSREGKCILMVIHDLSLALQYADNIILMENGNIVMTGTPEEVFRSGKIDDVFNVKVRRISTESGHHYYCEGLTTPIN